MGGRRMGWGEALRLTGVLARDPSSQVGAALAGWQYPLSREGQALVDLYDLQHMSKARKGHRPKPYPRPWDPAPKRYGRPGIPQDQVRAALRAHGHDC